MTRELRSSKIEVSLTATEKKEIRRLSKDQGKSMSGFLRDRGLIPEVSTREVIDRAVSCVEQKIHEVEDQCVRPLVRREQLVPPPPPPPPSGRRPVCRVDPNQNLVICELEELIKSGKLRRLE